jgi:hypothetical protein
MEDAQVGWEADLGGRVSGSGHCMRVVLLELEWDQGSPSKVDDPWRIRRDLLRE